MRRISSSRRRHAAGSAAGFSVLEILVVLGVIGLVAALGIPNLLGQLEKLRLESSASEVANLIRQTRLRAIRDQVSYQIDVDVPANEVSGQGLIDSVTLELSNSDVQLYAGGGPVCVNSGSIVYQSTGVADAIGTICLFDGADNILQVSLDFPAGPPKIRKYLKTGDGPDGAGFYEKLSAADGGVAWTWY